MTTRKTAATVARLGVFLALAAACATATDGAAERRIAPSVTTLMAGWEQKFAIEWTVAPEQGGAQQIRGYVTSRYGQHAEPFRVLGRALDGSGTVVGERIAWIPGGVPGFSRAYFVIQHLPAAERYVVTVWDYSIVEAESGGAQR